MSGYRGVWREEKRGRTVWRARLKFGPKAKAINCGSFATAAEAARAYDARLRQLIADLAGTPAGEQLKRCARYNMPAGPSERPAGRQGS